MLFFLSCTIGTPNDTLQPQHKQLEEVREHAQNIESLILELQNTLEPSKQPPIIEEIIQQNILLQEKTRLLKQALKVSPETLPSSEPLQPVP